MVTNLTVYKRRHKTFVLYGTGTAVIGPWTEK